MARLLASAVLLAAAAALSACGRPQPVEPAPAAQAAPAQPELLGAPPPTTPAAETDPDEGPEFATAAAPPRRPGWGTMAPIPNPDDGAPSLRAQAGAASYRVIGPTLPEAYLVRSGPSLRTDHRPPARVRIVADASPTPKGRIRHWIVPVTEPRKPSR